MMAGRVHLGTFDNRVLLSLPIRHLRMGTTGRLLFVRTPRATGTSPSHHTVSGAILPPRPLLMYGMRARTDPNRAEIKDHNNHNAGGDRDPRSQPPKGSGVQRVDRKEASFERCNTNNAVTFYPSLKPEASLAWYCDLHSSCHPRVYTFYNHYKAFIFCHEKWNLTVKKQAFVVISQDITPRSR